MGCLSYDAIIDMTPMALHTAFRPLPSTYQPPSLYNTPVPMGQTVYSLFFSLFLSLSVFLTRTWIQGAFKNSH